VREAMRQEDLIVSIKRAVTDGRREEVLAATRSVLAEGMSPREVIEAALVPAIDEVGRMYVAEELFLPEMMESAETFQAAMEVLQPLIEAGGGAVACVGTVVLGTVRGDIHSIGKDILALLLRTAGFSVHDLGVDVAPFDFVSKAQAVGADIIACSALLTTTLTAQRDVVEVLADEGRREDYKVMVGGGATSREWADSIGADGWAATAYGAVEMARRLSAAAGYVAD